MAHPKHKLSKQRRDKRRTHDFAPVPTLSVCPNCGATVMYHRVCPECGYYRGRQIIVKSAEYSALFSSWPARSAHRPGSSTDRTEVS